MMTCLNLKVLWYLLLHVKTALQMEQDVGITVSTLTVSADVALSEIIQLSPFTKLIGHSFKIQLKKIHNIYHKV